MQCARRPQIGSTDVPAQPGQVGAVIDQIKEGTGRPLAFRVRRGGPAGEELDLTAVPERSDDGKGKIGVMLAANVTISHTLPAGLADAAAMASAEFGRLGSTVAGGLAAMATNFAAVSEQLSGPVAIVAQGSQIARRDTAGLYQFAAIVNINLAVVNALPLPALDGGYLALLGLEALRGKKLPEKLEQGVMASGFLLLTALGIGLVVRDTLKLL